MKKAVIVSRVSLFPPEHGGAKNLRGIIKSLTKNGIKCDVFVKIRPPRTEKLRLVGQDLSQLKSTCEGVSYYGVHDLTESLPKDADAYILCDDVMEDGSELFKICADTGLLNFFAQTIHALPFGPYSLCPSIEATQQSREH